MSCFLCSNALVPREIRAITFQSRPGTSILYAGERKLSPISCTRLDNSQRATTTDQQQLNLSVLRFTLGIRGLDESYLPRWIGYTFGSLLLLNHFVGSDSATITPVQLRSEALGLSLAGFSVVLPFLGKFLKIEESQISCQDSQFSYQLSQSSQPSQRAKIQGAPLVDQAPVPENAVQIFVMSQHLAENFKEDLAWGTYVLLRNTNTISVLISVQDALCVRGYWNVERDLSKVDAVDWFQKLIQRSGLSDLKDTLYFSQIADSELREMLPKGIRSLLVQPVPQTPKGVVNQIEKALGFVLLASTISYAYSDKDRAWVGAIANKFKALAALPSGIR